MSARVCAAVGGLILATSGVARAEPQSSGAVSPELQRATSESAPSRRAQPWRKARAAPPSETSAVAVPAPLEPEPAPHTRQGFFSRFGVGLGVFTASAGAPEDRRSYVGLPLSFEAYFGGTLTPWLALGGGYLRDEILALSSSDAVRDGDEPQLDDTSFCLEALSVLISAYPHPRSPFYGTLTVGVGRLYPRGPDDSLRAPLFLPPFPIPGTDPGGVVFSLGGGYDTWLDEEWAVSVSARVLLAPLGVTENGRDIDVTVFTPSVLVGLAHL